MCGRVYQTLNPNLLLRAAGTNLIKNRNKHQSSYNMGPGQYVPVIKHNSGKANNYRELDIMKWGYPAPFGRSQLLINARSEEASDKRTFKPMVNTSRAVMVVEGYFEWTRSKQPHVYRPKEDKNAKDDDVPPVLYIACLVAKDDSVIVLTRDALKGYSDVHDRMPVLLDETEIDKWLDLNNDYDKIMKELLNEKKQKWTNVYSYKVNRSVNNMSNDTEKNIESVDGKGTINKYFDKKGKGKDEDDEEEEKVDRRRGSKATQSTQATQPKDLDLDDVDELEEEEDDEKLDDVERAKKRDARMARGKGRGKKQDDDDEEELEEEDEPKGQKGSKKRKEPTNSQENQQDKKKQLKRNAD